MRGRFGRKRVFGGGSAVWLGVGALVIILALIMRKHEKTSDAVRVAYRTARERLGNPEQPARLDTKFPSEQAGMFIIQEKNRDAESEESTAEVEEGPSEEPIGITRAAARRGEEDDGGEEDSQNGQSAAAVEEGRAATEGLPIEEYDSLTVSQIMQRLRELRLEEVEQLRDYEAENRNRRSMMQRFETRIRAARKNLKKRGGVETEENSGE